MTHRAGTRFGPRAIREASSLQPYDPPYGWPTNPLEELSIIDYGDCAFDYAKVSDFPDTLTAHIRAILAAGAGTVTLGGDHYITYPILKAYAEKFGPLGVIHFDAHSDLWPDDDLSRIDHGTMLYKAVKTGIVDPKRSVQIGIRTTTEDYLGVNVIDAREVHEKGVAATVAKAKDIVGDGATYVTFDIDCLDPAYAPGTGTPEPGGLTARELLDAVRRIAPSARLTFVRNQVEAHTPEPHPGQKDEALARGHKVNTRERSSAEITFADQSRLALGEETLVVVLGGTTRRVRKGEAEDTTLMSGTLHAQIGRAHV